MKLRDLFVASLVAAASASAWAIGDEDQVKHYTANDGTQVTVVSGQPEPRSYGPKPSFEQLDANHDGGISRAEAAAFIPLLNDFDNLAHHVEKISANAYARWDYH